MTHAAGRQVGIGIIGAGNVLGRYLAGMSRFPQLAARGCATRSAGRARAAAARYGIGHYDSVPELLAAPDVEVVLNITPPVAHAETTAAALAAGKHVYVEKPITTLLPEAQRLASVAEAAGLLLGAAPDTFLGSAGQTARRAVDDGSSVSRSGWRGSARATGWRRGIPIRRCTSSPAADRCRTWARTTSPRW
jgi:predicted dehydrogenase